MSELKKKKNYIDDHKHHAWQEDKLLYMFNVLEGYYNLNNNDLYNTLLKWNLSKEDNQCNKELVSLFIKWSFTVSFLMMINAWQWFMSSIVLDGFSGFLAQKLQNLYYTIFFAEKSFLALNSKGIYTVRLELNEKLVAENKDKSNVLELSKLTHEELLNLINSGKGETISLEKNSKKIRRRIWLNMSNDNWKIEVKDIGREREHIATSNWFHEVFNSSEFKEKYPAISFFINDRKHHTEFRNWTTYCLETIAEELFEAPKAVPFSNQQLIDLWHGCSNLCECYPEIYYGLEYLKLVTNIHSNLMQQNYESIKYESAQKMLIDGLYKHNKENNRLDFIKEPLKIIFEHCYKTP